MALFYILPLEDGKAYGRGQGGEQASVHRQMPGRLRTHLGDLEALPTGSQLVQELIHLPLEPRDIAGIGSGVGHLKGSVRPPNQATLEQFRLGKSDGQELTQKVKAKGKHNAQCRGYRPICHNHCRHREQGYAGPGGYQGEQPVHDQSGRLCFAKKLQNSHYSGPRLEDGVGVLLCSVPANRIPQIFSFHPLTANSGFAIFSRDGALLYQSDTLPDLSDAASQFLGDTAHQELSLNGSSYIYSSAELDWGLHLLFLTPYSDITGQLHRVMLPYLICSLIFLIIGALSSLLLSRGITRPVVHLTRKIESIEDTRTVDLAAFSGLSGPPEIRRLNTSFGNLIRRVNRLTGQIQKAAEQRRISELRALQAQMNPHFVLNAMNTVNYMALMRGQDDIAATVDSIASLMRYSITDPDKLVSIHTEVENIREYISIYTLRFRQEIRLEISADRPDTEIFIPKFTLQPLVENSIRHGITRQDAGITVFLRAWEDEDRLYVQVTDTGRGADPDKLNAYLRYEDVDLKVSHGFGIRNVNERIQLHFGGDSGLTFSIDPDGRLAATLTICTDKKSAPDNKI